MRRGPAGLVRPASAVVGLGLAWGLFEAQWVERRELDVPVPGLPAELEGFTILHLSDFHLGSLSLNARALRKAAGWAAGRRPDLVVVTGDLLSRDRGEQDLLSALACLRARHGVVAVLGNHDVAVTRDPFSGTRELQDLSASRATLLKDSALTLETRGLRVQVVGVDPRSYMSRRARPERSADPAADLRILLSHFPRVVDRMEPGAYQVVLAGHVHGGQICLPTPFGKVRFADLRNSPYAEGVFTLPGTTLVVSRGTGTAFVPFRFFARPEVAELVLRAA